MLYFFQWLGNTDIDLSYDEEGLWAIYATHENAQDIVLSKIDVDTLEVKKILCTDISSKIYGKIIFYKNICTSFIKIYYSR